MAEIKTPADELTTGRQRSDIKTAGLPDQPLIFVVTQPETEEEKQWYALGYDGAATFAAVPVKYQVFYDLGQKDKADGKEPRATWMRPKAVSDSPTGDTPIGPSPGAAPVWPLLAGGLALTAGVGLLVLASKRK